MSKFLRVDQQAYAEIAKSRRAIQADIKAQKLVCDDLSQAALSISEESERLRVAATVAFTAKNIQINADVLRHVQLVAAQCQTEKTEIVEAINDIRAEINQPKNLPIWFNRAKGTLIVSTACAYLVAKSLIDGGILTMFG